MTDELPTFRGVPMRHQPNTITGAAWLLGFNDAATVLRNVREKAARDLEDDDVDRQYVLEDVLAAIDVLIGDQEAQS